MNQKPKKQKLNFDITKFTLLRDLVLIQAIREEQANGLINPNQYEDKAEFGEVIGVGGQVVDLKKGDIVRFGKYSTETIRTNGNDYYLIHEEDISAVLR